jgi:hypothetical protein
MWKKGANNSYAHPSRIPRFYRVPWAALLKRVFLVDLLECPNCAGRMKILAVLTAPAPVRTSQREAAISVIVFAAIESPEIAPFAIATSATAAGAAPLTD